MKKLISASIVLGILSISSFAFAERPVCTASTAAGVHCTIGNTTYVSCGDNSFIKATNYAPGACTSESIAHYDPNGNPIRTVRKAEKQRSELR